MSRTVTMLCAALVVIGVYYVLVPSQAESEC
jgi:hypothetical protein